MPVIHKTTPIITPEFDGCDGDVLWNRLLAGDSAARSWDDLVREDFRHTVAYLDIETTGLGGPSDHITTLGCWRSRTTIRRMRSTTVQPDRGRSAQCSVVQARHPPVS